MVVISLGFLEVKLFIYGEIRGGCRMGGLRQSCARTIHGYYIFGLKFPFLCLFELLLYEATKAYEYNNDLRYKCGMIMSVTTTTTITAVVLW